MAFSTYPRWVLLPCGSRSPSSALGGVPVAEREGAVDKLLADGSRGGSSRGSLGDRVERRPQVGAHRMLDYGVFIFAGVRGSDVIRAAAGKAPRWLAVVVLPLWSMLWGVAASRNLDVVPGVTALSVAGAITGVLLARLLDRSSSVRWLGRRSLPVFLMNMPPLIALTAIEATVLARSGVGVRCCRCSTASRSSQSASRCRQHYAARVEWASYSCRFCVATRPHHNRVHHAPRGIL